MAASDTIEEDGLWIGKRRRGGRFVRYPNGEIRQVDRDFDPACFHDPDSVPTCETSTENEAESRPINVPDVEASPKGVQAIALALLDAHPTALVAIAHNSKGEVIGATITRPGRGLTAAAFRASFRSLPNKTKGVTFAARLDVSREVKEATMQAADSFLVRVLDFIVTD